MDRPSSRDVTADRRVVAGRYVLLAPLGSGGMGTVWRAHDEVLGREVAVKELVFPHGLSDDEREVLRERTRREARAAARLDHPSAVTVYDVVEQDGSPFLVMELVEARTLAELVRHDGPLSPQHAAQVGLAVLGALQAAHAEGIVHRDVKPGNVLLQTTADGTGRVVLTDFGIATSAGDPSITSTGMLLGSPSYIAPERARGERPGPASDLWALGATLFTAVEGRPPYDAGDPLSTVTAVVTGEHAPFAAAGPLAPVIAGLLEKDPDRRLDAASARPMLEQVARGDAGAAPAAPAHPASEPVARAADRTSALPVGPLHEPAAEPAAEPASAEHPTATPPPAEPPTAGTSTAGAPTAGTSTAGSPTGRPPARAVAPAARSAPPARPARPAPARRRRGAVPLVLALVLLAAAGLGGVTLLSDAGGPGRERDRSDVAAEDSPGGQDGDGGAQLADEPTDESADESADEPADESGEPDGTDQDGAPRDVPRPEGVPAEWPAYTHPSQNWTLFHPPNYQVSDWRHLKQFRDPTTRYTLRVDHTDDPRPSALQAWQEASPAFAQRLTNYRELRLEQVEYRGYDAADLEFSYTDGGADLRVLDRTFVVGEGEDRQAYALYWQVPADRFEESLAEFQRLAAAFVPAS